MAQTVLAGPRCDDAALHNPLGSCIILVNSPSADIICSLQRIFLLFKIPSFLGRYIGFV